MRKFSGHDEKVLVVVLQVLMHVVKFYKTHGPRIHVKTGECGKGLQFSS